MPAYVISTGPGDMGLVGLVPRLVLVVCLAACVGLWSSRRNENDRVFPGLAWDLELDLIGPNEGLHKVLASHCLHKPPKGLDSELQVQEESVCFVGCYSFLNFSVLQFLLKYVSGDARDISKLRFTLLQSPVF